MAMRFAASKGRGIQFQGFQASGRGGESIGAAAGMSTMPNAYKSFRGNSFRGDKVASQGVLGKAQVRNAVSRSNAALKIANDDARAITPAILFCFPKTERFSAKNITAKNMKNPAM